MTCSVCECLVNGPPFVTIVSCWNRFSLFGGDDRGSMMGESRGKSAGISPECGAKEPAGAVVEPFLKNE